MTDDPRRDVDDELQFHLEQRTRDYVERGMSPEAAREAAAQRVGDTARVRKACTAALSAGRASESRRTLMRVSWLDVKLGLRMFAKYPGLSLVAVAGMAIAIALGAGYFSLIGSFLDFKLPIDEGDRVVRIRNRHVYGPDGSRIATYGDGSATAFDLIHWRSRVRSVAGLSAFRDDKRNLITEDGRTELVRVAAITASGLSLARVQPRLGRTITTEDEHPGAPPVVVISHEQWLRRFDRDSGIVGRTVRLGGTVHTIVGVMPDGFAFPIRHEAWVPLRLAELDPAAGAGPPLDVFGRLADGYSMEQAQAELTVIGEALAIAFPQSHATARPDVRAYAQTLYGIEGPAMQLGLRSLQFGTSLLLLIVAVNVAVLVYARTATRFGEITVRTALGASRGRVIAQLFVEALVLCMAAAALGLTLLTVALRILRDYLREWPDRPDWWPYWLEPGVSTQVIVYVLALGVIAAILIGVLPALKATSARVQASLQQFSARGAGMQLGRTWTLLIVAQVAIAVAALPGAIAKTETLLRMGMISPSTAALPLIRGSLRSPAAVGQSPETQLAGRINALMQRLQEEPEVSAVTFAESFPGTEPRWMIEAENPPAQITTHVNRIALNLFDVLDVRLLAGRSLTAADTLPAAASVIVDQAFADRLAPGANVIGRRLRFPAEHQSVPNRWMEIVGVVPSFASTFTAAGNLGPPAPTLYMASVPRGTDPVTLIVKVRSDPSHYSQKLQQATASVGPDMALEFVAGVAENWQREQKGTRLIAIIVILLNGSVLLLSAAGIHALMAFTVARRRREIGIRVALGADARAVLRGIFGRAILQVGAGVAAGLAIAGLLEWATSGDNTGGRALILFPSVAAVMFGVGVLAALGPARRGLAVQPTEALRNE